MPAAPVLADRVLQAIAKAHTGAPDAMAAIAAIEPLSAADAHFLRVIASHAQHQQPAAVLVHFEQGLDSLMAAPWCRLAVLGDALKVVGTLSRTPAAVQDPRYLVIFEKLDRDYPVHIARSLLQSMRCEMALRLKLPQQLAAVESMGRPFIWQGSSLAMRVSAYLQANDPRLGEAMADMNRFLDQGGTIGAAAPPFVVQVKPSVPDVAPMLDIVVGAQVGK